MQITDEVTADGKAKMLILIGRNQGNQAIQKHSMNIDGETFKLMKRIYF
jgi:hypothetical protein